ncbi:MAG: 5-formyltetrahydrofolate cyclo-ligase [bacterium]|nr:5-formyltetrahydrofolate cyclo-ligase [bacterium]
MRHRDTKSFFRAEARGRSAPDAGESQRVCEQVTEWLGARKPTPTLVWIAMSGELDLSPVVEALPQIEWLTTRTPSSGPLTVHPHHSRSEPHRFGFRQPVAASPQISPEDIGVVLAPGLVFDRRGGRLGWGKGYYDRLLAQLTPGVPRVGVTLERLLVDRVPQESHDILMTHLITERGVRKLGSVG